MKMTWTPERLLGISLFVACLALWFIVVPNFVEGAQPRFFPRLAIAWIALFSLLTTLFPPRTSAPAEPSPSAPPAEPEDGDSSPSVYGLMALWGVYAISIGQLGFYLATFLMLAASMYYLGIRKLRALLLRPTIALAVIYLLLDVGLNFRLPKAFWQ